MGALGLDLWGLIVQLIAFLIFIYLFWRYALGPITNMLDERSRRILGLRFFQGLTQSQIAAEVGVSQMHVSRLLSKALEMLRSEIEE